MYTLQGNIQHHSVPFGCHSNNRIFCSRAAKTTGSNPLWKKKNKKEKKEKKVEKKKKKNKKENTLWDYTMYSLAQCTVCIAYVKLHNENIASSRT